MTQEQFDYLFDKAKELMERTKDPVHNWAHVERVIKYAWRIKKLLNEDWRERINDKILSLAIAWHDISFTEYKQGFVQINAEARRSVKIARKYFEEAKLLIEETELILDVIWHHSYILSMMAQNPYPWLRKTFANRARSIYHKIVQDADLLDTISDERLKAVQKLAEERRFYRFVLNFIKPLLFRWLKNKRRWYLNLPESARIKI